MPLNYSSVKRDHAFKGSPVIAILFLVGQSTGMMSEGNVGSETTLIHSLVVLLKKTKTMNPVALPTVQGFSSCLGPLKAVVVPELSMR